LGNSGNISVRFDSKRLEECKEIAGSIVFFVVMLFQEVE
jgi:hypothetical protein